MRQMRDRAQRELDRLDEVMDTFRKLDVGLRSCLNEVPFSRGEQSPVRRRQLITRRVLLNTTSMPILSMRL